MITKLITVNQRKNNTLKTLLILKGIERVFQSWQRESNFVRIPVTLIFIDFLNLLMITF